MAVEHDRAVLEAEVRQVWPRAVASRQPIDGYGTKMWFVEDGPGGRILGYADLQYDAWSRTADRVRRGMVPASAPSIKKQPEDGRC